MTLWPLAVWVLVGGCATGFGARELHQYTLRNEFAPAAARLEQTKSEFTNKNILLYHLDHAMLLHLAGEYEDSNRSFSAAERAVRDMTAKSVTAGAATFLVNDAMRAYDGEDFERTLIHVFSAINYAALGRTESALVECRRLDVALRNLRFEAGAKNAYQEDAFGRYLAGLLYEDAGDINNAHISYLNALSTYDTWATHYKTPRPDALVADALRTARAMGFGDREREIRARWGAPPASPRPDGSGEVVVLHYAGRGPEKTDSFFEISLFNGWPYVEQVTADGEDHTRVEQARAAMRGLAADKMVRVAFPVYRRFDNRVQSLEVADPGGGPPRRAERVADIGAIAERSLADRIGRTRARAIARAVVKYVIAQNVSQAVENKNNETLGFLVKAVLQAAAAATETADKRAWRTLPDQIRMARLVVPAGLHDLTVTLLDTAGAPVETRTLPQVRVTAGQRTFRVVRSAL